MNYKNILKVSLAALASLAVLAGCAKKEFKEITELSLKRCLEPQNLSARVDVATGDHVAFGWDVNKDADGYLLTVYTDEEMTEFEDSWNLEPDEVPAIIRLTADQKYWFTVQAYRVDKEGVPIEATLSNLAVYDGSIKTYAVKDNLFLEVTGRTENSVSLAWSSDASDYEEVTELRAVPVKGGETVTKELSAAEKTAAAATIAGLESSTEYQITLFYMSASRGARDTWTKAEKGEAALITSSEQLKTAAVDGGDYYLAYSETPYELGGSKPTAGLTLIGELDAEGNKPVVIGNFDISGILAANSSFYCEGIKFDDQLTHNHLFNYSGGEVVIDKIEFVNCEITNFKAGLLYNNKADGTLKINEFTFDSCDIYEVATTLSGDFVDLRKGTSTTIPTIKFINNTIYDGVRTFFRIDNAECATFETIDFENNTLKNVSTADQKDNRGIFAVRTAHKLILKNNLFLHEWSDPNATFKAQLFQNNAETYVDAIQAENNYAYNYGDAFFTKVSAADAGVKVMNVDPCYNSKGNFFQLAAQDLIDGQVGASKWWISYVEKPEDLTQNALEGAHVWNLQDAKLFAGNVKNSRVRDELLLVGTEATPLNADGAINFLSATVLNRKGQPIEGYAAFKIADPGSVDILLSDPNKAGGSVVIALYDDNGLAVQGGAAVSSDGVQKILVPEVEGEGIIYIYALGPVSITKLAWSEDVKGGNKILATPKLTVDPVTVTEGDETAISVSWEAVEHAASYTLKFNKKTVELEEGALSYTVPAEDVVALAAGLYNFTIEALPLEGDIYYVKSETGTASIAIQPKGGSGEIEVEKTITWDFSTEEWLNKFKSVIAEENKAANFDFTMDGLTVKSSSGKWRKKSEGLYYFQTGTGVISGENPDHYFKFTVGAAGKLKVTAANTGGSNPARAIYVVVNGSDPDKSEGITGTTGLEKEFDIAAGEVYVYPGDGGLSFYKIELTYTEKISGGDKPKEDHVWDFSTEEWLNKFKSVIAEENKAADFDFTMDGLTVKSSSGKWRKKSEGLYYFQTGTGVISGENPDHYFKFTVGAAGKLKVTAANTGGSNPARAIYVVVNGSDPDKSEGITGTTGLEKEFDIAAGEVYVYPGDGGLSFYKIEFHSN